MTENPNMDERVEDESNVEKERDASVEEENGEKPKRRRRMKRQQSSDDAGPSSPQEEGRPSRLPPIKLSSLNPPDEIVLENDEEQNVDVVNEPTLPGGTQSSQPINSVFVQQTNGFQKTDRELMLQKLAEMKEKQSKGGGPLDMSGPAVIGTMQTGLIFQTAFHTAAVILQGLVAGFTLCHCLMVIFFTPPYGSYLNFINQYAHLAMPTHAIGFLSFTLCTIAALDRFDVGTSFRRVVFRAITLQSAGLSIVAYFVAIGFSLFCLPIEHRMSLYLQNNTHYILVYNEQNGLIINQPWLSDDMDKWKIGLIGRTVAAIIAWCLIALRPSTDLLTKHMLQADHDFRSQWSQVEQPSSE